MAQRGKSIRGLWKILKQTADEWLSDDAPQLGAALAFYSVFSLAPLTLLLFALVGFFYRTDSAGAWTKLTEQMSYFLDPSALGLVQEIARKSADPGRSAFATAAGISLAIVGASGVFGQLQNALNIIWAVKAVPGLNVWRFLRARFLSFAMVAGVCFLLLVSLTIESLLKAFSHYVQAAVPGGIVLALAVYWIFDLAIIVLLFAGIFKLLPDVKLRWADVWVGAMGTATLFALGKWAVGLYLASGSAASVYGPASSLMTLLLWFYYSSQILLFGAEFTQVYSCHARGKAQPEDYAVRATA